MVLEFVFNLNGGQGDGMWIEFGSLVLNIFKLQQFCAGVLTSGECGIPQ
jgi:hypothetical protein